MKTYLVWTGPNIDPLYGAIGANAQGWEIQADSDADALAYAKQTFAPWSVIVAGPDKCRVPDDAQMNQKNLSNADRR